MRLLLQDATLLMTQYGGAMSIELMHGNLRLRGELMSIKATFFAIFATLIVLLVSLVVLTSLVVRNQRAFAASEYRRYESFKLADELRQSSDDLTRMARTYVVTGDPIYEQHFQDILAIRNGEKPRPEYYSGIYWDFVVATDKNPTSDGPAIALEQLMRQMHFTDAELHQLKVAQNRSDALVRLESIAMNAVKGKFDDGAGRFTIHKAPDLALAQRLMHGKDYHAAKARIMEPINAFFQMLEDLTTQELQALQNRGRLYTQIELALTGIAVLFTIGAFMLVHRRVLTPVQALVEGTQRIEQGDYSQPVITQTSDEMGMLSQGFNRMVESLQQDTAARQQVEADLRQSEEKFRRIVEGLKDDYIFYSITADDVLTYISPSIETVLGYTQEEAYANNYTSYLTDNPVNLEAARIYQAEIETGKASPPYEMEFYHKQGSARVFEVQDTLVFDTEGKVATMEGIARDVTQRKQAEAELQRARAAAEAANESKSTFLATMSHEIRTPMNAIINMTVLALETEVTRRQRQYLTVVNSSAGSLLALINDILDFSKIEAGRMEFEIAPFYLRTLLEEITDAFRGQVLEKKLEFVVHVGMDVPEHLMGDTLRLRQVLINLIGNAFKFTEQGEVVLYVSLIEREPSDAADPNGAVHLRFAVRDTGMGIPKHRQDQLFDAFEQADRSTSRKFGGTGLGLAISRRLVAMMGGDLQLESETDQGSEFFFTARFNVASDEVRSMRVPPGIDKLRALVIDDNASARELLAMLLEQFGMSCVLADSAEAGLALLQRPHKEPGHAAPFDLVLLDWLLPGVDGLEAAGQIRGQLETADLPIILISAFAGIEEEHQAQTLGINAFVPKPITASSLFDVIMDVFQVAHPRRPARRQRAFDEQEFVGRKILLAEDNEANQFVAKEILSLAGIALDIAENGRIALERVGETDYDAVLMDMQMPEMDGLEATRRIRSEFPDRRLPIIALTANAMKGDLEVCLEAGMDDYIAKPIDRQQLFHTLRKWLPVSPRTAPAVDSVMTPTAAPVSEPAVDLPGLPGIDAVEALQRLGLSYAAYENILFHFADGEPQTLAALQVAFESRDWETVRRHAHALAGSAGNVSANELREQAKQLELAVKDQTGGYDPLHHDLQAEAQRVFAGINRFKATKAEPLKASADAIPTTPVVDTPVDLGQLVTVLEELESRLSEGDLEGVTAAMEPVRQSGLSTSQQDDVDRLQAMIGDFDFMTAAELVADMRSKLTKLGPS